MIHRYKRVVCGLLLLTAAYSFPVHLGSIGQTSIHATSFQEFNKLLIEQPFPNGSMPSDQQKEKYLKCLNKQLNINRILHGGIFLIGHGFLLWKQIRNKTDLKRSAKEHSQLFVYRCLVSLGSNLVHQGVHAICENTKTFTIIYDPALALGHQYAIVLNSKYSDLAQCALRPVGPLAGMLFIGLMYKYFPSTSNNATLFKAYAITETLKEGINLLPFLPEGDGKQALNAYRSWMANKK